jgi:hypothetical protein
MPTLDPDSVSAYLTTFLGIIMKLERLGSGRIRGGVVSSPAAKKLGHVAAGPELTEAEIEERELVEWASLKECQIKFMRETGVGSLM